jgi:hypothetical protein
VTVGLVVVVCEVVVEVRLQVYVVKTGCSGILVNAHLVRSVPPKTVGGGCR